MSLWAAAQSAGTCSPCPMEPSLPTLPHPRHLGLPLASLSPPPARAHRTWWTLESFLDQALGYQSLFPGTPGLGTPHHSPHVPKWSRCFPPGTGAWPTAPPRARRSHVYCVYLNTAWPRGMHWQGLPKAWALSGSVGSGGEPHAEPCHSTLGLPGVPSSSFLLDSVPET